MSGPRARWRSRQDLERKEIDGARVRVHLRVATVAISVITRILILVIKITESRLNQEASYSNLIPGDVTLRDVNDYLSSKLQAFFAYVMISNVRYSCKRLFPR
jgi:hypothetical protein